MILVIVIRKEVEDKFAGEVKLAQLKQLLIGVEGLTITGSVNEQLVEDE